MTTRKIEQQNQHRLAAHAVCLNSFFSRRNVELYRKLADKGTNAAQRRAILELLAQERIKDPREKAI